MRTEGPFGDHTGFYSLADEYPVFHVTCLTRREQPIYATTIVGPPPMEDYYMGKAIERIFLPLMRLQLPEVRDIAMPAEGVFHNLILVSMRKSYPGHARKVMHAIWGTGQAMFSKCIVVVDEDVDDPQVARRGLHAAMAGRDRNAGGSEAAGGRSLEAGGSVGPATHGKEGKPAARLDLQPLQLLDRIGGIPYGGCSSAGRAPDCGSGGRGFESLHPPQWIPASRCSGLAFALQVIETRP